MNEAAIRSAIARGVAVIGLAGLGLIHLLDAPSKLTETPYMFWMYLALMLGTLTVAAEMIRTGSQLAWTGALTLAASAATGFILTRTTGLPQAHGDIGNWTEPLGMASLWVEGCLIALSLAVLPSATRVTLPARLGVAGG